MFLGIEIGGSKLQLGLGAGDGNVRALWRDRVDVAAGAEGIRAQILRGFPELLRQADVDRAVIRAVGIGFGGPVDDAGRTVIKSHQIGGWDGFPLADWIARMLGRPAVLGNDADVAGLAEALYGAGKGLSPVFYITIGSGIGGGLIVAGQIYRGCGKGAAEIGHVLVAAPPAGKEILLEHVASGWAIGRRARDLLAFGEGPDSLMRELVHGQFADITARHVGEAARHGDPLAVEVLNDAGDALWQALRHVIVLLCPKRIIIGGGVALIGDILFDQLRRHLDRLDFVPFAGLTDIVPARLGEEVVVHGALALAAQSRERKEYGEIAP
jgi:glucokinase